MPLHVCGTYSYERVRILLPRFTVHYDTHARWSLFLHRKVQYLVCRESLSVTESLTSLLVALNARLGKVLLQIYLLQHPLSERGVGMRSSSHSASKLLELW